MVTLYCQETPNLKLGPGTREQDPDVIVFHDGYAELNPADPLFTQKMAWIMHSGTPHIRILDDDEPKSAAEEVVRCPECAKAGVVRAFPGERQLNGHLIQHRRKE